MPQDRLYTDKEISAILKRAAERHTEQGTEETLGLSLEELQQVGQTFEWTYTFERQQLQVTLSPGQGQTKIRIHGDFSKVFGASPFAQLIIPILAFFIALGLSAGEAGASALASLALGLCLGELVYVLIHFGFDVYVDQKKHTAKQLMKRLEAIIAETDMGVPSAMLEAPAEDGRITLSDDESVEEERDAMKARKSARG